MKIRRLFTIFLALTSLVLAALALTSCSGKLKATTIRLVRQEGTIELTGDDGKERTVKDNLRFMSGDILRTRSESLAGLSLDDAKAVLMNADSCAEFHQEKKGKWLEIDLTEGDLFFSVDEKLKDDESFEIRTSTMVIGIRGTSGYVTADAEGRDMLIVTEGTVHVSGINPDTGEIIETDVSAGQQVTVYLFDRPTESVKFHLENVAEKDLQPFALFSVTEEEPRLEKVCRATGWDPDLLRKYAGEFPEDMHWLSELRSAEETGASQAAEESTENTPVESGGVAEESSSTEETEESGSAEETTEVNTRETLAGRNSSQTTAAANTRQTIQAAGQNTTAAGSTAAANTAGAAETAANTVNTAAADNTAANTNQTSSSDTLDDTALSGSGPSGNSSYTDDVDFDPNEDDEEVTEAATEAQTQAQTEAQTQVQTEAQTQAQTEAQTQAQTKAQTQAQTAAAADGSGSSGSDGAGADTAGSSGGDGTGSDTAGADSAGADDYSVYGETGESDFGSP